MNGDVEFRIRLRGSHRSGRHDDSGLKAGARYANLDELKQRVQAHALRVASEETALATRIAVNRAAALARVFTGDDQCCRICQVKYPLTELHWQLDAKTSRPENICRHCRKRRDQEYAVRRTELARKQRAKDRRKVQAQTKSPYQKRTS